MIRKIALVFLVAGSVVDGGAFTETRSALAATDVAPAGDAYARQKENGFQPRRDVKPWPLSIPLDWGADPFKDRNWQFHLHAWRMTDPMVTRYSKTGDAAYLDEAMTYVRDWYIFHLEKKKEADFSWYDMATGLRAMRLAFLQEQISTGKWDPSEEDRAILRKLAAEHATRLQVEKFINLGNHGMFQTVGLEMLCENFAYLSECRNGRAFAAKMYDKITGNQFTDEGIHRENSPGYHRFALDSIENVGGAERFNLPDLRRKLDLARAAWPFMVLPNGSVVQVGDSEGKGVPLQTPDKDAVKLDDGREFAVRDWSKSGYIVVRSNPPRNESMLFVMGMNHVLGHKHADNLSFVLYEHGRPLFIDSGKYAYYKGNPLRDYVLSAAAHNTVSLADKPQIPSDVLINGTSLKPLEKTGSSFVVRGSVSFPKLGYDQSRVITYAPGHALTVADTIDTKTSQELASTLVLPPDLVPTMTDKGFSISLEGGKKVTGVVREDCKVESVRGQKDPPLGWVSFEYLKIEPTTVIRAICSGPAITWDINLDAK